MFNVLSRRVDQSDAEFKDMVNAIVDFVNEDANCRTRIEKERFQLGWKIAKINEVLEKDFGKKIEIET